MLLRTGGRVARGGLAVAVLAALVAAGVLVFLITRMGSGPAPLLVSQEPLAQPPAQVAGPVAAPVQAASSAPVVDPAWVARIATSTGIPAPAVRAYATAQLAEPSDCEVGWTTLAGIGWVESQHGTLDGRSLGADGRSSTPVLGPALDGDPFAAIPATPETSVWHGDPVWDHAVGPLQFIPSTWEKWAVDGDGDGATDPNDIDDAAAAAVAYLCADGHDLASGAGWADAVFGYNHDQAYVDSVYAAATTYAARSE
jgi:membrane-bound lytic murein transglycosylase B